MDSYDHIDITEVLMMAARCVRGCPAVRQLAGTMEDEDEGIDASLITLIDALPVCVVAGHLADVVHDDLVCVDICDQHAIIAVVTPEGRCDRPEIVSHEQLAHYLAAVDTSILLPSTRYDGQRIMVLAGQAAHQIAEAAGGLGVLMPKPTASVRIWIPNPTEPRPPPS